MTMTLRSTLAQFIAGSCIWLCASHAQAFIQATENFDTNWPGTETGNWTVVKSATNTTSGWSVNALTINSPPSTRSSPYAARLLTTSTNVWIQSPLLTNGVGSVVYFGRSAAAGAAVTNVVETSADGITWLTNGPPNVVTVTSWAGATNTLNTRSNLYLRLRILPNALARTLSIDDISISTPPAQVTYDVVQTTPATPMNGDSVNIGAELSIEGSLNTLSATLFWRDAFSPSWNAVGMLTNGPGSFMTSTPVPPRQAGATVQFYLVATHDSDMGPITTNYPGAGAAGPAAYTVRERSDFTGMAVTGAVNSALLLVSPYQWQSAAAVSSLVSPSFHFLSLSNGVNVAWGDADPAVVGVPAFGTAEPDAAAITLPGTLDGALCFSFNERSHDYSIQRCAYQDLESWTNAAFGTYTNAGWVLKDGLVTNDPTRALLGAQAVLNGKPALTNSSSTNSFILSPYLSNGVGQVSFWFRSYETGGSPTGMIVVQKAASPTSTWTTLATTNTTSTNYLWFSVGLSDREAHAVRILNNPNGNNARVCIDEIIIAEPGAGVTYSNLVSSPESPTIFDPVDIGVDITPEGGATALTAWTYFRFGTNGVYDVLPMTLAGGNRYVTETPIPRGNVGTVQYFVKVAYTGFQSAASSPAYLPSNTNVPAFYTSVVPQDNRTENFDTNWPGTETGSWTVAKSATNAVSGWSVNAVTINTPPATRSPPYAARLLTASTNIWIKSPLMSNGIGSVVYSSRSSIAGVAVTNVVETSANGADWVTNGPPNVVAATSWVGATNTISTLSNLYVRLRVLPNALSRTLSIDDITVSYPAASVAVSDVLFSPGFPSATDAVGVSCLITSQNAIFPAVNLDPTLYYRPVGLASTFTPAKMVRSSGDQFVTGVGVIPPFPRDTKVEYYVRCDFNGYHTSAAEDRSPTFYPAGAPAVPAYYVVRAAASPYGDAGVLVNGSQYVAGRLLSNNLWQTVFTLPTPTNRLELSFLATDYADGTDRNPDTVFWGHSNTWQTTLPLAEVAATGQPPVVINGSFSGSYLVRFNEATRQYIVEQCLWQGFDAPADDTTLAGQLKYVRKTVSSTAGSASLDFETLAMDVQNTRTERFAADAYGNNPWQPLTDYLDGQMLGFYSYDTFGCVFTNVFGSTALATKRTATDRTETFVAQINHWDPQPRLQGIGTISCKYRAMSTNTPAALSLYLFPTSQMVNALSPKADAFWQAIPNASFSFAGINTWTTNTVTLQTNATWDVIFGATQSMYMAEFSISDWYAVDRVTVDGWEANQSWIERRPAATNNVCRLEASRAVGSQHLQTPPITGGVDTLTFDYCGATTNPVSFQVQISYSEPPAWTSVLSTVSGVPFAGTRLDYSNFTYSLASSAPLIRFRVQNQTPVPGALLLDNVRITGYTTSNDWYMNNAAIQYMSQTNYPLPAREFYYGACFLNSNRLATTELGTGLRKPDTNVPPCLRTPVLGSGVGEVSFWYRNWATSGVPVPAQLVVQTSLTGGNLSNEWTTIAGGTLTNIVNTNDYAFYQGSIYDPNARYVRVYNDDLLTNRVGRVCLDDFLVTAPMATTLGLSNLVVTPAIPVYTDQVDVAVDVHHLFLNPTNIQLQVVYAYAANYAGLATAPENAIPMECIATNPAAAGGWYRFRTTSKIPALPTDTYVKYSARATFGGYHTEVTSPMTHRQFGVRPDWYYPMTHYTNNSAYYVVYSCPTGTVWINEVNPLGSTSAKTNEEYAELCGLAGVDLSGWSLENLVSGGLTQAVYNLANGTVLANEDNGHGFWVIGGTNVPARDMTLTVKLGYPGGVRLRRSMGAYEHAVCYGSSAAAIASLTNLGFVYTAPDISGSSRGISAVGTGSVASAFTTWVAAAPTPGLTNVTQLLMGFAPEPLPPTFAIYAIWVDTNVWLECTRTNGWSTAPWYTTTLADSNSWQSIPVFTEGVSAGNTLLSFPPPTNTQPGFYKVKGTSQP